MRRIKKKVIETDPEFFGYYCSACNETFYVSRPYMMLPFCPSCGQEDMVQEVSSENTDERMVTAI
jgi:rRNA maturation endonuclease Nob1